MSPHPEVAVVVEFLGNLHPAAVHFPVALIVVAAAAELAASLKKNPELAGTGRFVLAFGAVFGVVSGVLGFMASSGRVFAPELKFSLDFHRISGIAAAGLAVLATALAWGSRPAGVSAAYDEGAEGSSVSVRRKLYRVILIFAVLAVLLAAYFGAEVTHGPGHLFSNRSPVTITALVGKLFLTLSRLNDITQ
jgi:uncharacterized membrane protein